MTRVAPVFGERGQRSDCVIRTARAGKCVFYFDLPSFGARLRRADSLATAASAQRPRNNLALCHPGGLAGRECPAPARQTPFLNEILEAELPASHGRLTCSTTTN